MYLCFNNSNKKYECTIEKIESDIKVSFINEFEPNSSGFRIYSDTGKLLGSYQDHVVIKESFADGFTYSTTKEELGEVEEHKTLGERLEETNNEVDTLKHKLEETQEALNCTNNAMEELLLNYILKEEETIEENE